MWVVPGATVKKIRNKSQGVRDKTLGLILHVQVGYGELTGWFDNPGSQASSAWQVRTGGQILQFGDPDADKFWTQGKGNPDYGAVETEGHPEDPLTPEQVEGVAQIFAKGHLEEGWPFQLAEKPGDRGLGWHGMGGAAWGNHPLCPGTLRKAQRPLILARARQIVGGSTTSPEEDDMPLTEKDYDEIAARVWEKQLEVFGGKAGRTQSAAYMLSSGSTRAYRLENGMADPAAIAKAVAPLLAVPGQAGPVTDAQLESALRKVLGSLDEGADK